MALCLICTTTALLLLLLLLTMVMTTATNYMYLIIILGASPLRFSAVLQLGHSRLSRSICPIFPPPLALKQPAVFLTFSRPCFSFSLSFKCDVYACF